jgi:hypothetical protein
MDYVFHGGDPTANDALRLSSAELRELLELAEYPFRETGDALNATEFFYRMTRGQIRLDVGSESWNKAEELLSVAQNASLNVVYTPLA